MQIIDFATCERGSFNADMATLVAGTTGLGLAVASTLSSGTQDVSENINEQLNSNHIHTTFDQFKHAETYDAALDIFDTVYEYEGHTSAQAWMDAYLLALYTMSEEDLIDLIDEMEANLVAVEAQMAAVRALDPAAITSYELAMALGEDHELVQTEIDERFAGANENFTDYREAVAKNKISKLGTAKDVANERGVIR